MRLEKLALHVAVILRASKAQRIMLLQSPSLQGQTQHGWGTVAVQRDHVGHSIIGIGSMDHPQRTTTGTPTKNTADQAMRVAILRTLGRGEAWLARAYPNWSMATCAPSRQLPKPADTYK
jgi:hypothetical protein